MTFKNNNGKIYEVLALSEDTALLKEHNELFIVAYGIDFNRSIWSQGKYFNNLDDAKKIFYKVV